MKVLYFTRDYSPHDERFLTALGLTGYDVHYLRLEPKQAVTPPQGVKEVSFPVEELNSTFSVAGRAIALSHILDVMNPDVIHAGPLHGPAYITALTGFPRLVSMSWGADILHDGERSVSTRKKIRQSLDHSSVFVCDCLAVAEKAVDDYSFPSERIFRFPWGVDLEHFTPLGSAVIRDELGWQDKFVFLSNRSFEPIYGVDVTLQAFSIAARNEPDIRLLLFGKGSQEQMLRQMVEEEGITDKVFFGGFVARDGLPDSYRSADVFLSASHCDGSSVSLMEALACGVPALASDIPGNLEWVRSGKNGWIFQDSDFKQMAALMQIARHEPALEQLSHQARALAEEKADWSRNFAVLLEAYEFAGREVDLTPGSQSGRS